MRPILILAIVFIISYCVYAEEAPILTLDDCVKAALANNPKLRQMASKVDVDKANVGIAKSGYLPQASTTGGYAHYDTSKISFGSFAVSGIDKRYNVISENTGASQLIWDFGQTLNRIKAAKETLSAAQYEFLETQENTILNAEKSYFNVMRTQLLLKAAKDKLEMTKTLLGRAEGFYEVGYQQPYDVTKAELSVANANLELVTANKDFELAKVSLNNIMGNNAGTDYRVIEISEFHPAEINIEAALKAATTNRVELSKLQAQARAAQADLEAKKKGNWPTVSFGANNQISDTDTPGVGNVRSWNAGAQVSWPWFDGFKTKSEIEAAQASLKMVQLGIEDQTLMIALEVQNAVLALGEAKERINATQKLLQESSENLEISKARHEEGLGSLIEVADAETNEVSAKQTHASAIAGYLSAFADYQKSIGVISPHSVGK
ncbi:MAG: TolC family protein [Candidatus Omnitrophota bacterium]|nr:TolC family protein [Candidatus Omnitrophota bacterium]